MSLWFPTGCVFLVLRLHVLSRYGQSLAGWCSPLLLARKGPQPSMPSPVPIQASNNLSASRGCTQRATFEFQKCRESMCTPDESLKSTLSRTWLIVKYTNIKLYFAPSMSWINFNFGRIERNSQ